MLGSEVNPFCTPLLLDSIFREDTFSTTAPLYPLDSSLISCLRLCFDREGCVCVGWSCGRFSYGRDF